MTQAIMAKIDALIARDGPYMPRWGWHDDHRHADGTDDYQPALQQVRSEFAGLLDVMLPAVAASTEVPKRALQLGLGECHASHDVLQLIYGSALTIDWGGMIYSDLPVQRTVWSGRDTHSPAALHLAKSFAPYDFLMVDAGHRFEDVRADHLDYGPLVRPGGIIAFHDALVREGYPELGVAAYLATLENVQIIGTEVGVAWIVVRQ